MLDNLIRTDGIAKKRRRIPIRKGSLASSWEAAYQNERDPMHVKETRNHWNATDRAAGPGGLNQSTAINRSGHATLIAVPLPTAAYQAKAHMSVQHIDRLMVGITRILMKESSKEQWVFKGGDEKLERLSRVVVESWLMPDKYFRLGHDPIIKVFSNAMDCSPQTWRDTWFERYEHCKSIPESLYSEGLYTQTGEAVAS